MVSKQLKDQGYDREEEYFRKQEQELMEKMKKKKEAEKSKSDEGKS